MVLELCIYGSALLLAYGFGESTKDVDATIRPSEIGKRLVRKVAADAGLHEEWLNDDVRHFVSDLGTFAPLQIEELETSAKRHLKITRPSASYLLAMKCLACREDFPGYPRDIEDIEFLIRKMGITTIEQIEPQIDRFYPRDALTPEARGINQALLQQKDDLK